VDEAPDFSWMQLGCMYHLAHPAFQSFCMSGDLMQRVTAHGLQQWQDVHAFAPDVAVHTLSRVYRQSHTLLRVAGILYEIAMKEPPPFSSPFAADDEPPPLHFRSAKRENSIRWVADRILDVYESVGRLPSIAVFVADEADVSRTADALAHTLSDHAIEVESCVKGKVLGVGDRVRVFAIEHIKGLEFHAVFLMDFDRLNRRDGELAMRYLYLGLTRAVMFLGVTMAARLPQRLAPLGDVMEEGDWRRFAQSAE
jgi:DNA helicase IV